MENINEIIRVANICRGVFISSGRTEERSWMHFMFRKDNHIMDFNHRLHDLRLNYELNQKNLEVKVFI